MKKKVLLVFSLSLALLFGSLTPIYAALNATPGNKPPVNQRDMYNTDLFSGSASYSYPISVPKGTDDLTPNVSLFYSSGETKGLSQKNGVGWTLQEDFVERDANFTPGDTSQSDDKYRLSFQGQMYDLIDVSSSGVYHTKIESNLRINKLTTGEENDSGEYWQVITKDGTKYRFGQAVNSEQKCNTKEYAYRWKLDLVEDTHGNKIYYTYSESYGASYLSKIEYNTDKTRVIEFTYAPNPYERTVYTQGCKILESSILSDINIKTNTNLVRSFNLSYVTATNSAQLLNSITEKGSSSNSALPVTNFGYNPEVQTISTDRQDWLNHSNIGTNLGVNTMVIDVIGDGKPDIVKWTQNGGTATWSVWQNLGGTFTKTDWTNSMTVQLFVDTTLVDVNGDGLADFVKETDQGSGERKWSVWLNTGSGWSTSPVDWTDHTVMHTDLFVDTTFADVNGDSLVDIVKETEHGSGYNTWSVWLNTGNGWSSERKDWIYSVMHTNLFVDTTLADVNGDGLADIVKETDHGGGQITWSVWLNTGNGWLSDRDDWIDHYYMHTDLFVNTVLTDMNGDGLPDIVKETDHGGGQITWNVWPNIGSGWSTSIQTWTDHAYMHNNLTDGTEVNDMNGDGLPDIVKETDHGGGVVTWSIWPNVGHAPNMLTLVKNSQGGTINFEYAPSTQYDNTGADDISDLPFASWIVSKMTVTNGLSNSQGTSDVTTYTYKNGMYKWQDKEFRGFGEVHTVEPNGSKKIYVFHQNDGLSGKMNSYQVFDSSNNIYSKDDYYWSTAQTSGVYTSKLDTEKHYTYDGSAANDKIVQIDYLYDTYGNITKKSELGDTSVTGDERFTYNQYVYNTSAWIVNTVKRTYRNASNDTTKVSESTFYYDGHTGLDEAPAKGDLTKEVKWLEGLFTEDPTTLYTYDSFGNQISVTDANNHTTTTGYDTTGTYPVSSTNAKNQTSTTSYDLGTGNLLSKADPNGFATTYVYDVFGRLTKEIKHFDTADYPTVSYQYFFDGTAPEGTLVSKREVSGQAGTLDVATYIDGLGRKVQTRSDAENTSQQIVADTFYDPNGEVLKETVPYLATASTSYVTPQTGTKFTEFTYDPLNRVTITKNPKGDIKTTAYDHWKETTIDEKGHIKRNYKNAYGKTVKVEEVNNTNTYTTNYTYNARDELTRITDNASNNFDFEYDTLGRKTKQIDPDLGTWEYTYDKVGNQLTEKDNKNITVTKTYDELNRITLADYPTDTDIVYTYDGNNKKGTLTSVVDVAGTVNYGYDERLRKIQESRVIDGTTMTTAYTYDAADRVLTRTNPDNTTITYTYNAQGEVDVVDGVVSDIDYNAQNKITTKEFANGVTTNYTYNTTDFRLSRIQTGTLFDSNYTYDQVGNIETITDNLLSKVQTYGYDDLDRLTSASESAGFNYSYEYNPIGNLTKFVDGTTTIDYTYGQNSGPHALTSSTEEALVPGTELLTTPWQLVGNNGSDQENTSIPANSLVGKGSVRVTFNLHGASFGGGDDEASVYFVQNGDWRAANITLQGAQNGLDGVQTVIIPISAFHKVGDANVVLDPNQAVSDVGVRFWNSGAFTVDITSIKLLDAAGSTPTPTPTTIPTATPTPGSNGTPYGGTAWAVPGTVQVENFNVGGEGVAYHDFEAANQGGEYRTTEGVDIGTAPGQYGVGWTREGEWLNYAINVASSGSYTFNIRVTSPNDNAKVHVEVDGVDVTGPIVINSTGGWDNWATLTKSGVNLTAGQHNLKLVMEQRSTQEEWVTDIDWFSFVSESTATPTPTPTATPTLTPGAWTELLGTTWTLAGSNGSSENSKGIASNALNGKTTVQVTFNLHGVSFGNGDDEASIYFVQNGDWRAANLIVNGAQNGLNGSQTITIPISSFHKVGDSGVVLDPAQAVSDLGARFWNSGTFSVDVTSVKVQ